MSHRPMSHCRICAPPDPWADLSEIAAWIVFAAVCLGALLF
jgi:hypothetical protein